MRGGSQPPPGPQQWRAPQAWRPPAHGSHPTWAASGMDARFRRPLSAPPPRRSGGLARFILLLFAVAAAVFWLASMREGEREVEPAPPLINQQPSVTSNGEVGPAGTEQSTAHPGLPDRDWPEIPPPNSTDPNWVTLQQSVLYTAAIPALTGCPPPERARTLADLERIGGGQMSCIQRAWRPTLEELGLPSHEIPVYYYAGDTVETQCGQVTAPALYCSFGGGTVYIGEATLNGSAWHDFAVKDMTGHEYTHHLQALAGMFEAEYLVEQGNEGVRRSELQATCGGYAMIARDDSYEMDEETFYSFEPFLRAVIEDGIHGSKDSVAHWGLRGLYSSDLGHCNTWTAASEDVD